MRRQSLSNRPVQQAGGAGRRPRYRAVVAGPDKAFNSEADSGLAVLPLIR
jgi:hypothetical protein